MCSAADVLWLPTTYCTYRKTAIQQTMPASGCKTPPPNNHSSATPGASWPRTGPGVGFCYPFSFHVPCFSPALACLKEQIGNWVRRVSAIPSVSLHLTLQCLWSACPTDSPPLPHSPPALAPAASPGG
jgi:hypothetical protein